MMLQIIVQIVLMKSSVSLLCLILVVGLARADQFLSSVQSNQQKHRDVDPMLRQANIGQQLERVPWEARVRFDNKLLCKEVLPAAQVQRAHKRDNIAQNQQYHDIFMRYLAPHKVAYGHVAQTPDDFEQRFESFNNGNRYKGAIKWYDAEGGYGENYWNLAQGNL